MALSPVPNIHGGGGGGSSLADGTYGSIQVSGGGTLMAINSAGSTPILGAAASTASGLASAAQAAAIAAASPVFTDFTKDIGKGISGTFDITGLSGLVTGKPVAIVQTPKPIASKGNATDEAEFDAIIASGVVLNGTTIRAIWNATGIVVGTYAFAYLVSA